jgi:hypothetical protein
MRRAIPTSAPAFSLIALVIFAIARIICDQQNVFVVSQCQQHQSRTAREHDGDSHEEFLTADRMRGVPLRCSHIVQKFPSTKQIEPSRSMPGRDFVNDGEENLIEGY